MQNVYTHSLPTQLHVDNNKTLLILICTSEKTKTFFLNQILQNSVSDPLPVVPE